MCSPNEWAHEFDKWLQPPGGEVVTPVLQVICVGDGAQATTAQRALAVLRWSLDPLRIPSGDCGMV